MMTSKNRLMVELNLTPEKFGKLLDAKRLTDKPEYTEQETSVLKDSSGKGFTPSARADRSNQPTEATEQKGIVTADTHGAVRERVIETANAGSDLVQSLVSAAQTQARQQAKAIAAYPQLVDQLTVMYLEESGVTEPGKPTEIYSFSGAIEGMSDFQALLEASGSKSKQIAAARSQRQLSGAS